MRTSNRSEKIKLYIVAGLSVIFLGLGYYRFLHTPGSEPPPPPSADTQIDQWEIPAIALAQAGIATGSTDTPQRAHKTLKRNIFKPLNPPPAVPTAPPEKPLSTPPKPSFVLKGTILGGASPVAIIDDQFLRPGDPIGAYRLVRIENNRVWLAFGQQQLELEAMVNDE